MSTRFVITEFFRTPDEDYGIVKVWYYKNTINVKRRIEIHNKLILDKFYDIEGNFHRDFEQPAYICSNGEQEYYYHGKKHRNHFEPAIIRSDGTKEYWVYGEFRSKTNNVNTTLSAYRRYNK